MSTFSDPATDQIYELLFCDDLERYRGSAAANEYPWNALLASGPNVVELERVVSDPDLETRPKIVAANLLDRDNRRVSDRITAYALYTDPPLGRAGMTEAEARRSGRRILVAKRAAGRTPWGGGRP